VRPQGAGVNPSTWSCAKPNYVIRCGFVQKEAEGLLATGLRLLAQAIQMVTAATEECDWRTVRVELRSGKLSYSSRKPLAGGQQPKIKAPANPKVASARQPSPRTAFEEENRGSRQLCKGLSGNYAVTRRSYCI